MTVAEMDSKTRTELEAAAFRRLVAHRLPVIDAQSALPGVGPAT